MKARVLILALAAVFVMTGCSKSKDENPAVTPVDAYVTFKADATPRWENGTTVENSGESAYTFVIDTGGNLFASAKYKTGRILSADGSSYEFIEFTGAPAVGSPAEPTIRKQSAVTDLYSLEIVKIEGSKLWIVFRETSTSAERKVVQ